VGQISSANGTLSLNCRQCVHWVSGLGVRPGQWAHREPAPHGEPAHWLHNRERCDVAGASALASRDTSDRLARVAPKGDSA
jgi:hypothetical protein